MNRKRRFHPVLGGLFWCGILVNTPHYWQIEFGSMKHGERRRSGRKILTHDFEQLPAQATLVYNLNHPDYVKILCGSLELLPQACAKLDGQKRSDEKKGRGSGEKTGSPPSEWLIPSGSNRKLTPRGFSRRNLRLFYLENPPG